MKKNWKTMLCFVLSAACAAPSATSAVFAMDADFEETTMTPFDESETETSEITESTMTETFAETSKEDSEDSSSRDEGNKEDGDKEKPSDEIDAAAYSWYQDPKTVYEAKQYSDILSKLKVEDKAEKAAIEAEQKRIGDFLSAHEVEKMYRVYNPNSGEHFYTKSAAEYQNLVGRGWQDEGIGWLAPKNTGQDVYRLYNPNGEHHFTLSAAERDMLVAAGWNDEGIGWKSADPEDVNNTLPVYREYNPNQYSCNHNYTTSAREHRILTQAIGWNDEKIGWTALSPVSRVKQSDGTYKIYDNESMKQLTGDQEIGGQMLFLDPANEGKTFSGIRKVDGKIYIYDENGNQMFGLVSWNGNEYLLDIDTGEAAIGKRLIGEKTNTPRFVCFDEEGRMYKGVTVDGAHYAADGTKMDLTRDEELELKCLPVYNEVGRDLHAVYNWTWKTLAYTNPSADETNVPSGWNAEQNFAQIGLTKHAGSGKVFAATFARLAKNLGYDAEFVQGQILLTSGWTDHGWVKIKMDDGKSYIFDPTFERTLKGDGNLCWKQDAEHPKYQYKAS